MLITDNIRASLQNHCRAAADKYEEDSIALTRDGQNALSVQFRRQAADARKLGDEIMEAESFDTD